MAKLITKFKYLKPAARQSVGGYAKYIATREGVEKVDDTFKTDPSTEKQKKLIERILRDFPDSNSMLEYEDYLKEPTLGNASEFITRALEDNANEALNTKTYADYIATRPRAERFGSHGLFTDDGVRVKLEDVSRELNEYEGNVWTVIISLRREDAERLGFNSGERWRDMLRTQTETIAKNFKIPVEDLKWYAAFHNESHHPHVHLKGIGSFRIDRVARCPKILDEDAVRPPKGFDLNVYLNSMFRMYNGERKQIELVCDNDLMDAIIDKFGKDVIVLANDMKSFRAVVTTATGPVFFSWVFGFGSHVSIKAPEDVKGEYARLVLEAAEAIKKTQ